jgi:hypothetical protein
MNDTSGWIDHDGGVCPVASDTTVNIRMRNGQELTQVPAGAFAWDWAPSGDRTDPALDVVQYAKWQAPSSAAQAWQTR